MKDVVIIREDDKHLMCVQANTFPSGIQDAHQKLHSLVPYDAKRGYYGISHSDGKGNILYYAAAGSLQGDEAEKYKLKQFVLRKGRYLCRSLKDYQNNTNQIGINFQEMLRHPENDFKAGYCVEEYVNDKDLNCLIKLID